MNQLLHFVRESGRIEKELWTCRQEYKMKLKGKFKMELCFMPFILLQGVKILMFILRLNLKHLQFFQSAFNRNITWNVQLCQCRMSDVSTKLFIQGKTKFYKIILKFTSQTPPEKNHPGVFYFYEPPWKVKFMLCIFLIFIIYFS